MPVLAKEQFSGNLDDKTYIWFAAWTQILSVYPNISKVDV